MMKKNYINKKKILIVAAHPDDEVLGCGGTITKSTSQGCKVYIVFMTNGVAARNKIKKDIKKEVNARKAAAIKACKIMGAEKPNFLDFQDNQLDKYPLLEIVKTIEKFIKKYSPSIIFSHYSNDITGQVFVFFILAVAAAESAIGLAIIVSLFRLKNSIEINNISNLKG